MMDGPRLAELTGAIARAADAGIGFPPETSLRLCLVAVALARAIGLSDEEVRDVYHAALLRHAGCTASAHEETEIAGDEIELRSTIAMGDAGKPGDMLVRLVQQIRATGKTLEQPEAIHHFTFKNGKVVRCRILEDTAATKAAFAR